MSKLKNPILSATEKAFELFDELTSEMNFTDITAIEKNFMDSRTQLLSAEGFELLSYTNKISGATTALVANNERTIVALWDEIDGGTGAILTLAATSLDDLSMGFYAVGDCVSAQLSDIIKSEDS